MNDIIAAVESRLAEHDIELRSSGQAADLTAVVNSRDGIRHLVVETKSSGHSATKERASGTDTDDGAAPTSRMLAERYISSRRGQALRNLGIPYVDTVGNMWLHLPGVHIAVEGRRPPPRSPRVAEGDRLSRPSSLRITFALLTQPRLLEVNLRDLATACDTSLGAAQATTADLASGGYLHGSFPGRRLRRTGRLADRWVSDFATRLLPKLEQRKVRGPEPRWWFGQQQELAAAPASLGGESACELLGYPLRAITTLVYGCPPWGAVRQLGRLGNEGQSDVVLREQFWPTVHDRETSPSLLVYADLLTAGDPRLAETASLMKEADDDLRRIWGS